MKLYIATLLNHYEYGIDHERTFVAFGPHGLASQVYDYLVHDYLSEVSQDEEEHPFDLASIMIECTNGNEGGEPLSMGVDTDLCHEYLLTTKVTEI